MQTGAGIMARGAAAFRPFLAAAALTLALGGCQALPRSGPLVFELRTSDAETGLAEGLVAPLSPEVLALVVEPKRPGFPADFRAAPEIDPERLGAGDVLSILIWETGEGGLFGQGSMTGPLSQTPIDASGAVFLPFAGKIAAAGLTRDALRERLRAALEPVTQGPQVDVRVAQPRSRGITVQGVVARSGPYVIDSGATRLTAMLALAGGATLGPEQVEVVVRRGAVSGGEMLADIYADPSLDVALRPGDVVILRALRDRFVAMGATSAQAEIVFPTRELTLMSAMGAARGLRDFDADPKGVLVLRREDRAVADALLPGPEPAGMPAGPGRPIAYLLDMTEPGGLFLARQFRMRDGDVLLASNAPLTELRKIIQLFSSVLTPIQDGASLAP